MEDDSKYMRRTLRTAIGKTLRGFHRNVVARRWHASGMRESRLLGPAATFDSSTKRAQPRAVNQPSQGPNRDESVTRVQKVTRDWRRWGENRRGGAYRLLGGPDRAQSAGGSCA